VFISIKYELISFIITLIIFLLVYLYLELSLKDNKNRIRLILLKKLLNRDHKEKIIYEMRYIKNIRRNLRLLFIIILIGLSFNKIIAKIPLLEKIFDYSIINHQLLNLKLINLVNVIFVFLFFRYLINFLISVIYFTYSKDKIEETSLDDIIKYLGNILSFIVILSVLGINLTLLIPLAGALGIGAGFALQDLLKNIIAGLIILFGKIVKKGDYVKFKEFEGYIKEVNLRTTIIRTPSNEEVIVPNSMLTESALVNYSLTEPIVRIDVPFGVSYSSDIKKIFEIAKEVGKKYSERDAQVIFKGFGSSALEFTLRIWINIRRTLPIRIKSEVYKELIEEFRKNNIEIPFNQLDIWFRNELKIKK